MSDRSTTSGTGKPAFVQPKRWYTASGVADELLISTRSVYRLLSTGKLKRTKIGRLTRISIESLEEYVRSANP